MVLNFQEFLFHEEAGWAYNPVMAPETTILHTRRQQWMLDSWSTLFRGLHGLVVRMALSSFSTGLWYEYTGLSPEESFGWG